MVNLVRSRKGKCKFWESIKLRKHWIH